MVPFRPHTGSPKGKTAWREVKAGIFARSSQRATRKGSTVSAPVHRHLAAVSGNIDDFRSGMQVAAVRQGILNAEIVVRLSDDGRGFRGVYNVSGGLNAEITAIRSLRKLRAVTPSDPYSWHDR